MLTQIGVFTALESTLDSLINLANETLKVFLSLELMSIRKIEAVAPNIQLHETWGWFKVAT